jgi:hypothetical protein
MTIAAGSLRVLRAGSILALLAGCAPNNPMLRLAVDAAPVATAPAVNPAVSVLEQYRTYLFTTTTTDPDLGDGVTSCEWSFGDGSSPVTVTTPPFFVQHTFFTPAATLAVTVTPKDASGLTGAPASTPFTVLAAPSPFTLGALAPASPYIQNVPLGGTAAVVFSFTVKYDGQGTVPTENAVLNLGNTKAAGAPAVTTLGTLDGVVPWKITVSYPAGAATGATYLATPSLLITDSLGIQSPKLAFPILTFRTVASP